MLQIESMDGHSGDVRSHPGGGVQAAWNNRKRPAPESREDERTWPNRRKTLGLGSNPYQGSATLPLTSTRKTSRARMPRTLWPTARRFLTTCTFSSGGSRL